jgi:(p)ppGpp synthase/HD superfamily hydrolase
MSQSIAMVQELARRIHDGQVDKSGHPYHLHVERVASCVRSSGGSLDQQVAAYLHDAVEDLRLSREELELLDISEASKAIVIALTQRREASRQDYIKNVLDTPGALGVKLCDIADNLDPERLMCLDRSTRDRLIQKYRRDLNQIKQSKASVSACDAIARHLIDSFDASEEAVRQLQTQQMNRVRRPTK